jgi:hypothetical protein
MATAKNAKPASRQGVNNRGGDDRYPIPPPPLPSNPTNEDSQVGFLIAFLEYGGGLWVVVANHWQ